MWLLQGKKRKSGTLKYKKIYVANSSKKTNLRDFGQCGFFIKKEHVKVVSNFKYLIMYKNSYYFLLVNS